MNARRGFSLLELMIVIAIAMLLVRLTTINARFFNRTILLSELNLLHAKHLLLSAANSDGQQSTAELVFDSVTNSYSSNGQIRYTSPFAQIWYYSRSKRAAIIAAK